MSPEKLEIRVRRTPIRLHWSLLPVFPILWLVTGDFRLSLVVLVSLVILVLVHEWGHAIVATSFGLRVRAIDVNAIHGLCTHDAPHTEWQKIAIAWGGVLAQLVLLLAASLAANFLDVPRILGPAIFVFTAYSLMLVFTNLIPVPPLDGATAWGILPFTIRRALSFPARRRSRKKASAELLKIKNKHFKR